MEANCAKLPIRQTTSLVTLEFGAKDKLVRLLRKHNYYLCLPPDG